MAERSYNIALTATDAFSGAFGRLQREIGALDGPLGKLRGALGGLAGAFSGLAGALSIGGFAAALKSIVDMADQLDDLSQKTGASVEELSRFAGVARVTGQDLGAVESSMARLAKALAEAQNGGSEAARAFQAFGINIRDAQGNLRTSGDVMAELARKQQGFADGSGKAAAMMALLGRSGAELIPFLNDYVEYGDEIAVTTSDQAREAGRLNDQLGLMKERYGALLREALLPTLGRFNDLLQLTQELYDRQRLLVTFNPFEALANYLQKAVEKQVYWGAVLMQLWENIRSVGVFGKPGETRNVFAAGEAAVAELQMRQLEKAIAAGAASFRDLEASAGRAGGALETTSGSTKKLSGYYDEMLRIGKDLGDELKASEEFWKAIAKAQEEAAEAAGRYATAQADALERDTAEREANIRAIFEQVNELEREIEQLGLSNEERERSTLLLALENSGLDVNSEAYRTLTERIEAATQAKKDFASSQEALRLNEQAAKATADEWQRTADSIRDSLTDALLRGFESGKDFAKNLRDTLVNMFKTLVLRPIIQGVLAPVSNGLGGLFGGFGGSPAGNILGGGLGGLFSGFEGLPGFVGPLQPGTFGAGLSSFFQGASSPLSTFGTLFGGGGLAAIGGIGGLLGAALPIVGIGAALASAFGLFDRGGPKTGGSASSLADILGGTTGLGSLERLFTPNQRDSDVQKVTDSIATSFLSVARSLGIAGGTAQFGLGFDTDPEGDAGNRVSALATLNGQTVYQRTDLDLGRDGDVTAALELEAKRALFAALQASDMPAYLANLFDGIDAAGATAEQIDGILQTAAALKIAVDAISGLGDQFAALDPADVQGFVEAFGGLEGLLQRVAYIGENFYTDAERLAQATTRLEESFDALGIAVPQTHQAFLALLNGLDLTTAEGREMYEAISALAPLFVEVRGTAQQAADALEDAAGALDEVAQAASNIIDLGSLSGTVYGEANSAIARIIDLAGTLGGSIGEQLTAQINLANGEIQRYIALWQQAQPGSAESQALLEIIGILQQFNQGTAAALAQYTSIVAQYGSEYADAIYQLQQQYWQQTQLFQGNTQALSALAIWYNEQLQAILEGTAEGVTGTISELDRLRESLQDYLAGLSLRSDLSPLSPAARLAEAQRQYQDLLARSQGGDVDALRDLQGAADAYLRIAREMFASGADYTNIFQSVVDALSVLSTPPQTGGPEPRPDALIAAALPTNSRLASQDDIEWLAAQVIAAIRDGSREQAEATARGSERVAIASRPLR